MIASWYYISKPWTSYHAYVCITCSQSHALLLLIDYLYAAINAKSLARSTMGLKSYFTPGKPTDDGHLETQSHFQAVSEARPPIKDDHTSSSSQHDMPLPASPFPSRPASLYPPGEVGSRSYDDLSEIKSDVMVTWLYQQQVEKMWTFSDHEEGVILKKARGTYTSCPSDIMAEPSGFFQAVQELNVRVSTTLGYRTRANANRLQ